MLRQFRRFRGRCRAYFSKPIDKVIFAAVGRRKVIALDQEGA
jgi:hypothetical protein